MKYRPDIDGLRAIAVLLVLIFHFDLLDLGSAGFMGVDMFFVISGYLISNIVRRDLAEGRFSFPSFYARRIWRLAPPLFVTQLLAIGAAAILLLPQETSGMMKEVLASQFYVSNIYYWRSINYFGLSAENSFMLHTWSLAVEEQFYLVFPAFLFGVYKWRAGAIGAALLALLVISFGLNLLMIGFKPEATFYLLPTRAWEFAAGALIPFAKHLIKRPLMNRRRADALAAMIGAGLILGALVLYTPARPFPGWLALGPVIGTALLILAGEKADSVTRPILGAGWLVGIGEISYSLYLVHWPIRVFGTILIPDYTAPWRWASFGLSFLLAALLFRFVEKPARIWKGRAPRRTTALAYAGSLGALALVATSALATGGWRGRFSPQVVRTAGAASDTDPRSLGCERGGPLAASSLCLIGANGVAPTWLIYGDSHAAALREAFSRWLASRGEAGRFVFQSGCLPLPNSGDRNCRMFNDAIAALLERESTLRNVGIVSVWRQPREAGYQDASGRVVSGADAIKAFDENLHLAVTRLTKLDRRILVWEPVPGAKLSVPFALARGQALGRPADIVFTRDEHRRTFGFVSDALDREGGRIAARIRPADVLCRTGSCAVLEKGRPLYSDPAHPAYSQTPVFSAIIASDTAGLTRN